MGLTVDKNTALPWGRNLDEYRRMFALSEADLKRRILGCSDGPASVNAELTAAGGAIVSVDPLYALSAEEIEPRVEVARERIMADTYENLDDYRWDVIESPEALEERRLQAVRDFLADYREDTGSRYINAVLPTLPFDDGAFDLALCSHFLFLYSDQFTAAFHVEAVQELLRVAAEVRIFPLLDLESRRSAHLDAVIDAVRGAGAEATIEEVPYEFQIGAKEMLRIR